MAGRTAGGRRGAALASVAREAERDMQKQRREGWREGRGVGAVSLRNESDKRKGLGRWAEETGSTLLN